MKKYAVILFDGMADYPNADGRTPMSDAKKPCVDSLAAKGEVGLVKTVPDGMKPGSDVANLSVMGYDPAIYYTGRSPLEALSMGLTMADDDVSYRMNLVTLSDDEPFENKIMADYSAGEIPTPKATEVVNYLADKLGREGLELHPGVSYRHCLMRRGGETGAILTPPHDISDRRIADYLPKGKYADEMRAIIMRSYELLTAPEAPKGHKANCVWLWGEGRRPRLKSFYDLHNLHGTVISAVDLIKGIGRGAGMNVPDIEGATGNIRTDFDAKARAAIDALRTCDFVYVHLEAPDECGHQGNYAEKTRSIELIDEKIVAPIEKFLRTLGEPFAIAVLPDHFTPVSLKTHVGDPVPYFIYDSEREQSGVKTFTEATAAGTGTFISSGVALMKHFLGEK